MSKDSETLFNERAKKIISSKEYDRETKKNLYNMANIAKYPKDSLAEMEFRLNEFLFDGEDEKSILEETIYYVTNIIAKKNTPDFINYDVDRELKELYNEDRISSNINRTKLLLTISQLRHNTATTFPTIYDEFFQVCIDKTLELDDVYDKKVIRRTK